MVSAAWGLRVHRGAVPGEPGQRDRGGGTSLVRSSRAREAAGNNDWFNRGRGASCGFDCLCVAKKGYDAPQGLGTPGGTGTF
jgi:hypothetical protein